MFRIESCAKQHVEIDYPSEENVSAQIESDSTATSDGGAQMETMSGVILNQLQPKFVAKAVTNEM